MLTALEFFISDQRTNRKCGFVEQTGAIELKMQFTNDTAINKGKKFADKILKCFSSDIILYFLFNCPIKMAKIEDSIRVLLAAQNQDTKEQLQQIAKNLLKV